jgi:alpha-beta hydrolase superfamily lysophospholipase
VTPPFARPHRASHTSLLAAHAVDGVREVDAVVVPSARGVDALTAAAGLAAELDARLLVLCSGRTRGREAASTLDRVKGVRWSVVDIPRGYSHPALPLQRPGEAHGGRASLSRKRNTALLVARMRGWNTLLFLDDDIRSAAASTVRLAAGGLGPAAAVGFAVRGYPDNSVVCHARRLAGMTQDVFVGASALLVDPFDEDLAHFPTVYNEDWLYLFDALAKRRVTRTGTVEQVPYDPFADPSRGESEEFGELLAEGLVAHLEAGGTEAPLSTEYWAEFRRRRAAFLAGTADRLRALRTDRADRAAAQTALMAAQARLRAIRPQDCVEFLTAWRSDRRRWLAAVDRLDHADDLPAALSRLDLTGLHSSTQSRRAAPAAASVLDAVEHPAAVPCGSAVIVPGFLDGRRSPAHHRMAAALADIGMSAVTFDPRGTAIRPDDIIDAGPTAHLGDIRSLVTAQPDDGPKVLVGHCYGAWLACLYAATDPSVTHLVAIMPTRFFLWPRDYDPQRDQWPADRSFTAPVPGSGVLRSARVSRAVLDDARAHDLPAALEALATRKLPMLFLAGEADSVIPTTGVRELATAAGPTAVFVELPGVQHDYRDRWSQRTSVQDTVVRWLVEQGAGAYSQDVEASAVR